MNIYKTLIGNSDEYYYGIDKNEEYTYDDIEDLIYILENKNLRPGDGNYLILKLIKLLHERSK